MAARTMSKKEECASDMEQRSKSNNVAVMGAQIRSSKEGSALGMGRRSNDAAEMDVQITSKKEEYA